MIILFMTAMAQDLPPTKCSDETMFCQIHKDRLATLFGKAKSADELEVELLASADKIDSLADELEGAKTTIDEDSTLMLALETNLAVSKESASRAKRQRNVAYIILGGTVIVFGGGAYIGSKL